MVCNCKQENVEKQDSPVAYTFCPQLKPDSLNRIALDCGLTIEPYNNKVTEKEIEFFAEQLVRSVLQKTVENYQILQLMI